MPTPFTDTFLDERVEDKLVKAIGAEFHKNLGSVAAEVPRIIEEKARQQGVSPFYVRYLLMMQRDTWRRYVGKHYLALSVALDLWRNHHRPEPRLFSIPPSEDEPKVDKAIMEIGKWASSQFVRSLIKPYNDAVLSKVPDLQRALKSETGTELSRNDAILYLRRRFREALQKRPNWFEHPTELQAIVRKLFVPGSDTSSPI